MDTVSFISDCLRQVHLRIMATCEGLSQAEALWRPTPGANNIGFNLWHVARGEDFRAAALSGGDPEDTLWVAEGWHERFGQSVDAPDPGDRMGFRALNIPDIAILRDYLEAAHARTQEYLSTLDEDKLDAAPDPTDPQRTVAMSLRHLVTHKNVHHGQIDFIRGLQDHAWDLPMGTGINLPPR